MKNPSALIIVDLQKDFLPGGALAVKGGDEIVRPINLLMKNFNLILATKDWHPENHVSFADSHGLPVGEVIDVYGFPQSLWPKHCLQNTQGAEFPDLLLSRYIDKIFYKGTKIDVDSYSAFFDNAKMGVTGLYRFLEHQKIAKLFFCGLASEFCVKHSVLDALELNFEVYLILDCCRGINPEDEKTALQQMQRDGAQIISSKEINLI